MKLIDLPMVCLNMERRPDRRMRAWAQFRRHGLNVTRIHAPDAAGIEQARGWMSPGMRACASAHRLAWRLAARKGADAVLVFEDDVILSSDFHDRLNSIDLPEDWQIFYFGCLFGVPGPKQLPQGLLRAFGPSWDNHAYAVRLSLARHTKSGLVFHGKMTRNSTCCVHGANDPVEYNVHTGGYRKNNSSIPQDSNTNWPPGSYNVGTQQTTGLPGYAAPVTNRTDMEVHGPGRSAGCIVFDDSSAWSNFQNVMNSGNNVSGCPHNPPSPLPMDVTFAAGLL